MKNSIVCLFVIISLIGCNVHSDKSNEPKSTIPERVNAPKFIHSVFFYFKDDADTLLKADFINGLDKLANVNSIQRVHYGPPAMTTREVVDNTYDYAWLVDFASEEDHELYQKDPIHLEFIEKYKSLWKEVKVYDNIVNN